MKKLVLMPMLLGLFALASFAANGAVEVHDRPENVDIQEEENCTQSVKTKTKILGITIISQVTSCTAHTCEAALECAMKMASE